MKKRAFERLSDWMEKAKKEVASKFKSPTNAQHGSAKWHDEKAEWHHQQEAIADKRGDHKAAQRHFRLKERHAGMSMVDARRSKKPSTKPKARVKKSVTERLGDWMKKAKKPEGPVDHASEAARHKLQMEYYERKSRMGNLHLRKYGPMAKRHENKMKFHLAEAEKAKKA